MHRLTATDTPMVRYTRTIFPSYAKIMKNMRIYSNLYTPIYLNKMKINHSGLPSEVTKKYTIQIARNS